MPSNPDPDSEPQGSFLTTWGKSALPPMCLVTLIGGLHARPVQVFPLLVTFPLVLSSYLSVAGFKIDAAAFGGAWSGVYALLALRRPQGMRQKFSPRGVIRGTAIGLGTMNAAAGGWTYMTGDRIQEAEKRKSQDKWGHGK
ncbi:hypothetical protein MKZ38_009836 [Zalerion maritima]|uniref:Uncharacterized protein n=1 Tax=Zalerion maritima TaxID=339359 RepID=A0AAD5RYK8_9PEZI|nr:hypothetical protein MKZ38_009836 [Zalerion maritima]